MSSSRIGPRVTARSAHTPGPHLPPTQLAIAAFTAFGLSSSSLVLAAGTLASSPSVDAEAMTLSIKAVIALSGFFIVSTFLVAGIYFGMLAYLRNERRARKSLEKRMNAIDGKGFNEEDET